MITKGTVYQAKALRLPPPPELDVAISSVFGCNFEELMNGCREEPYPSIRAVVYSYLRSLGYTYARIALFAGVSHTVVVHHVKNHTGRLQADRDYAASWEAFTAFTEYMKNEES